MKVSVLFPPILPQYVGILTLALTGIGLPTDCSAVSLTIGSTTVSGLACTAFFIALTFGRFHGGMTVLVRVAGIAVIGFGSAFGHGIAFIPLVVSAQ